MLSELLLLSALLGQADPSEGSIRGVVLNGSAHRAPLAEAEVVLRAQLGADFVSVAETTTDTHGCFSFPQLPSDREIVYLPGANRDGVHYPGKRVRLTPERANVAVELVVHDTIAEPCPLAIERYEIDVSPEPGVLRVREVLVIVNPTSTTYVGQAVWARAGDESEPVTLRLAIPTDFEQITFDEEFFGRRFSVENGSVVTHIPWTPGRRELAFTYVLRNEKTYRLIERALDLPCAFLQVRVRTDRPAEVACNLRPAGARQREEVTFQSADETLPAGYTVRVELGQLPVDWIVYGRVIAVVALVVLVVAVLLIVKLAPRRQKQIASTGGAGRDAR